MKALILAAGYATRLYPLTKDRPKALLPIADRPIINYIVDKIVSIPEVDEVIVISNHRFIEHFQQWREEVQSQYSINILIVDDMTTSEKDKLGAIGDIQFVIEKLKINDDLLIVAGDNIFTFSLLEAWKIFKTKNLDMILAKRHEDYEDLKRFAVVEVNSKNIVQFLEEKPEQPKSDLAVYATYFYKAETLDLIGQYLDDGNNSDSPGNFPAWLYKRKPVYVYEFEGECFDIGTKKSFEEVNAHFKNNIM